MTTLPADGRGRTALLAVLMAIAMLGLGFAAVPLYRLFCAATGFNGTTQRALLGTRTIALAGRTVVIGFDANRSPGLPWTFAPETPEQTVTIGAKNMAFFTATNLSDHPVTGRATFNVQPDVAGRYFTKIQCFCFTEQTLKPGQTVRMPVVFYVDPRIVDDEDARDVEKITLSYTFYPVDAHARAS